MTPDERRAIEHECRNIVTDLAHLTDHAEWEAAAALFAEDGVWVRAGKPLNGRSEIRASLEGSPADLVVRHMAGSVRVDVDDEDRARSVTYYAAYHGRSTEPSVKLPLPLDPPFSLGEWHDGFVRTKSGWRIARRESKRVFQRRD